MVQRFVLSGVWKISSTELKDWDSRGAFFFTPLKMNLLCGKKCFCRRNFWAGSLWYACIHFWTFAGCPLSLPLTFYWTLSPERLYTFPSNQFSLIFFPFNTLPLLLRVILLDQVVEKLWDTLDSWAVRKSKEVQRELFQAGTIWESSTLGNDCWVGTIWNGY